MDAHTSPRAARQWTNPKNAGAAVVVAPAAGGAVAKGSAKVTAVPKPFQAEVPLSDVQRRALEAAQVGDASGDGKGSHLFGSRASLHPVEAARKRAEFQLDRTSSAHFLTVRRDGSLVARPVAGDELVAWREEHTKTDSGLQRGASPPPRARRGGPRHVSTPPKPKKVKAAVKKKAPKKQEPLGPYPWVRPKPNGRRARYLASQAAAAAAAAASKGPRSGQSALEELKRQRAVARARRAEERAAAAEARRQAVRDQKSALYEGEVLKEARLMRDETQAKQAAEEEADAYRRAREAEFGNNLTHPRDMGYDPLTSTQVRMLAYSVPEIFQSPPRKKAVKAVMKRKKRPKADASRASGGTRSGGPGRGGGAGVTVMASQSFGSVPDSAYAGLDSPGFRGSQDLQSQPSLTMSQSQSQTLPNAGFSRSLDTVDADGTVGTESLRQSTFGAGAAATGDDAAARVSYWQKAWAKREARETMLEKHKNRKKVDTDVIVSGVDPVGESMANQAVIDSYPRSKSLMVGQPKALYDEPPTPRSKRAMALPAGTKMTRHEEWAIHNKLMDDPRVPERRNDHPDGREILTWDCLPPGKKPKLAWRQSKAEREAERERNADREARFDDSVVQAPAAALPMRVAPGYWTRHELGQGRDVPAPEGTHKSISGAAVAFKLRHVPSGAVLEDEMPELIQIPTTLTANMKHILEDVRALTHERRTANPLDWTKERAEGSAHATYPGDTPMVGQQPKADGTYDLTVGRLSRWLGKSQEITMAIPKGLTGSEGAYGARHVPVDRNTGPEERLPVATSPAIQRATRQGGGQMGPRTHGEGSRPVRVGTALRRDRRHNNRRESDIDATECPTSPAARAKRGQAQPAPLRASTATLPAEEALGATGTPPAQAADTPKFRGTGRHFGSSGAGAGTGDEVETHLQIRRHHMRTPDVRVSFPVRRDDPMPDQPVLFESPAATTTTTGGRANAKPKERSKLSAVAADSSTAAAPLESPSPTNAAWQPRRSRGGGQQSGNRGRARRIDPAQPVGTGPRGVPAAEWRDTAEVGPVRRTPAGVKLLPRDMPGQGHLKPKVGVESLSKAQRAKAAQERDEARRREKKASWAAKYAAERREAAHERERQALAMSFLKY